MFLKIKPFDTLFFRGGRPYSAGVDTWTEGYFPAPPSTFYGAIRSFLLFSGGTLEEFRTGRHRLKDLIGSIENGKAEYGYLRLKGVYLYMSGNNLVYFPSPKDLLKEKGKNKKNEKNNILYPLILKRIPELFFSDYNLQNILLWQEKSQVNDTEGWLDINAFKDYLFLRSNNFYYVKDEDLFKKEEKIGIAKDRKTFTSKEGYLYRVPLFRLKEKINGNNGETTLLVEIEDTDKLPRSGVLKLGGENKAAKFEKLFIDPLEDIKNVNFSFRDGYFKLYLATPAIFKNGWYPSWIDEKTFEGDYYGIKVKLITCVIGKPISVGGWDIAKEKAKPMRKSVPAGSVYYFKIMNGKSSEDVKEAFHFKNISDDFDDIKYSQEGFGLGILGEVKL